MARISCRRCGDVFNPGAGARVRCPGCGLTGDAPARPRPAPVALPPEPKRLRRPDPADDIEYSPANDDPDAPLRVRETSPNPPAPVGPAPRWAARGEPKPSRSPIVATLAGTAVLFALCAAAIVAMRGRAAREAGAPGPMALLPGAPVPAKDAPRARPLAEVLAALSHPEAAERLAAVTELAALKPEPVAVARALGPLAADPDETVAVAAVRECERQLDAIRPVPGALTGTLRELMAGRVYAGRVVGLRAAARVPRGESRRTCWTTSSPAASRAGCPRRAWRPCSRRWSRWRPGTRAPW